jgi:hypothetical protein
MPSHGNRPPLGPTSTTWSRSTARVDLSSSTAQRGGCTRPHPMLDCMAGLMDHMERCIRRRHGQEGRPMQGSVGAMYRPTPTLVYRHTTSVGPHR